MKTRQTAKPSRKEFVKGFTRLQKYIGVKTVSYYYLHPDGKSETLAKADRKDRGAVIEAENIAKRRALDIQQGKIIAGSVAEMIDRFEAEYDKSRFADQSKDGIAVRKGAYENLRKFFGRMHPRSLRAVHGYQYLEDRAKAGAPIKANKEISLMTTICTLAIRWEVMETNPFVGLEQNKADRKVRKISRSQIIRFYFWTQKQGQQFKTLGCAAMFAYLTGFRAAEVRPFHISGLTKDGVSVVNAKRKKGELETEKLRGWSPRLRAIVARAKQAHKVDRLYLFANHLGKPYSKSGWGSVWQDAMWEWLSSCDPIVAAALAEKLKWEAARRKNKELGPFESPVDLVEHPLYFSLSDVRPAAITAKFDQRSVDAYDFAAHSNPATTHKFYDRRRVKKASATE